MNEIKKPLEVVNVPITRTQGVPGLSLTMYNHELGGQIAIIARDAEVLQQCWDKLTPIPELEMDRSRLQSVMIVTGPGYKRSI